MAWFCIVPLPHLKLKVKLKEEEEEEEEASLPPPFPLTLSLPLPTPCNTITRYNFGSTDSLLCHIFASSVFMASIFLTNKQLLSWCCRKNHLFVMLWNNVTRFITARFPSTRLHRGRGISKNCSEFGNLPPDLCEEIGKRVESRLDIVRFRSVCKNWRWSLRSPTRFPLAVPPPPGCNPVSAYVITDVNYYHVKSEPVYAAFEEVGQGGKFRHLAVDFKHPRKVLELPLSQFSSIGKAYHLRVADSGSSFQQLTNGVVVITSSGVNPSYARASDLSVVVHLTSGRLALLRLGGSSGNWNWNWNTEFYTQIALGIGSYRGRLYTLDPFGRLLAMDYESLRMTQLTPPSSIACRHPHLHKFLFEAFGDLYLTDSLARETYKFSFQLNTWIKLSTRVNYVGIIPNLNNFRPFLHHVA